MPEFLAPGVFIEEVSFRSKAIEGVSTTTTGFVGPARFGPTYMEPGVVTCMGEFELSISEVLAMRAKYDSKCGAIYYPWVRVLDPITGQEINLPPSGFVSGIYVRNNIQYAVNKALANEVVDLALGLEIVLNDAQQDVLNSEAINCFRFFPGLGFRLCGARTISSDPEWKYVQVRRYFHYLERSIECGTRWAVFEPNGDALWAIVRSTIEEFLRNEWKMGALPGDRPEKAFFVRCDRSTMTQNDLDNGRLVCSIGVAPLRPTEFVIFRIGQWTADAKC